VRRVLHEAVCLQQRRNVVEDGGGGVVGEQRYEHLETEPDRNHAKKGDPV
jgi:hypothetical protein